MKALITGASGEIGSAIAKKLAEDGIDIIAQYNSTPCENLKDEIEALGVNFYSFKADLSDETEVKYLADFCGGLGGVEILVNNAGVSIVDVFQLVDSKSSEHLFDVNVKGAVSLTQKLIPSMIKQHYGKIVNVSSIWGVYGTSCEVHYSTSKAALIGFTKALAKEVGISGVNVNCVAPGFVETKMNAHLSAEEVEAFLEDTILGRAVSTREVADVVSFLVSEKSNAISGECIVIGG